MNKKVLYGIAGAVALAEYTRYQRLVDSLSVKPKNFKLKRFEDDLEIVFDLMVTNNSSKSIIVESVNGTLCADKLLVGSYTVTQKTQIDANSVSTLPISAIINSQEILNNFATQSILSVNDLTLNVDAIVNYKIVGLIGINVPIKTSTKVNVGNQLRQLDGFIQDFKKLFNL
jgi:LEA14-like dessication related protein